MGQLPHSFLILLTNPYKNYSFLLSLWFFSPFSPHLLWPIHYCLKQPGLSSFQLNFNWILFFLVISPISWPYITIYNIYMPMPTNLPYSVNIYSLWQSLQTLISNYQFRCYLPLTCQNFNPWFLSFPIPPPPYQQMVLLSLTFLKGRVDLSFPLTLTLSLSTKACISNSKYVTNLSTFIILDADIITSQMVYYNKPHTRLMSLGT